jgi:imidazolonepropionase-like amidohydrolase
MRALHARRYDTVRDAHDAGVPVYVGTDAGGSLPHGLVVEELLELQTAGLTPEQVLTAGSWGARSWLGRPGLEEGAPSDLLVLSEDPRADLRVLKDPVAVVLRGAVVR